MGARVLVVDDDPWILRMVTATLQKKDFVVDTAREGRQALERAQANPPDIIISDVMMPVMDGWTFVQRLRGIPRLATIPVIFLTALGKDEAKLRSLGMGPDDFLPKPFRFEELEKRVTAALQNAPAPSSAPQAPMQPPANQQSGLHRVPGPPQPGGPTHQSGVHPMPGYPAGYPAGYPYSGQGYPPGQHPPAAPPGAPPYGPGPGYPPGFAPPYSTGYPGAPGYGPGPGFPPYPGASQPSKTPVRERPPGAPPVQHPGGPQQGMPPQGMPPQGMPPQGVPPQGVPPQAMPPQGVPPQGAPPQQGNPPQAVPPQGAPSQGAPSQGAPSQGTPQHSAPPHAAPPQPLPSQPPPGHDQRLPSIAPNLPGSRRTTALNGRLEQLGLSSLLVMMEMERKDGVLSLRDSDSAMVGRIFLRRGQVISAKLDEAPDKPGKNCVYDMLAWQAGTFSFSATKVDMEDKINSSTTHLLMEGARRIDEANRDGDSDDDGGDFL